MLNPFVPPSKSQKEESDMFSSLFAMYMDRQSLVWRFWSLANEDFEATKQVEPSFSSQIDTLFIWACTEGTKVRISHILSKVPSKVL